MNLSTRFELACLFLAITQRLTVLQQYHCVRSAASVLYSPVPAGGGPDHVELWGCVLPSVGVECAGGCRSCGRCGSVDQKEKIKVSGLDGSGSPLYACTSTFIFRFTLCPSPSPLSSTNPPLPSLSCQAGPRARLPLQGPCPLCPPPAACVPH